MVANLLKITYKTTKRFFVISEKKRKRAGENRPLAHSKTE